MTLLLAPLLLLATASAPRATPDAVLDQLAKVVRFHSTAISPDGARVAWVEAVPTPNGPSANQSVLRVVERRAGSTPVRITAAKGEAFADESEPVFSPDGAHLAFLSDAASPGQPQLYVADLPGGTVHRLTEVKGRLAAPSWSPDGKRLALLFIEGGLDLAGPTGPMPRQVGVIEETYKEQRLAVLPASGGKLLPVSPADLFIYEYAWRPDGEGFAATGAHGSGDNNWWVARLLALSARGGPAKVLYQPPLQIADPTFSPDGKTVAFIGGLMSDQGSNGGDVFVMPFGGGKATNVTPRMRASASDLTWTEAGGLVTAANLAGESAFLELDPRGRAKPKVLWRGEEQVHRTWGVGAAFARDGRTSAAIRESFARPPEVYAGGIGAWTQLSSANRAVKGLAGPAKSIHWTSDGFPVQGWLVSPAPDTVQGKAPMIVLIHGGPASAVVPAFHDETLLFASQGYAVFRPNPRGSFGQGEAFTRAVVKDFGHGDLRDVMRGVGAVLKSAPVDGARLGLTGHSYGGFMSMWAVTQTHRFQAAVASAGIANWLSYYGENGIDQWMIPYFGASVYDAPEVYARSSPIRFIKRVRTPSLVLVGERDAECPAPQSFEFWHALKTLEVPTQLVVYPDEGHHVRKPEHVHDIARRTIGWFDHYLRKGS